MPVTGHVLLPCCSQRSMHTCTQCRNRDLCTSLQVSHDEVIAWQLQSTVGNSHELAMTRLEVNRMSSKDEER